MSKEWFGKITKALQNIMGFAVLSTICIVTYGVVARLCNVPVAWSDEIVRIIFIWLVFIGSSVAFFSDSLIGLDLVEDMLSKKPGLKRALKVIQMLLGLVFGLFMTWQTYRIVSTQFNSGETTPVLMIPLWLVNFGYFIGSVLFAFFAIRKLAALFLPAKGTK